MAWFDREQACEGSEADQDRRTSITSTTSADDRMALLVEEPPAVKSEEVVPATPHGAVPSVFNPQYSSSEKKQAVEILATLSHAFAEPRAPQQQSTTRTPILYLIKAIL